MAQRQGLQRRKGRGPPWWQKDNKGSERRGPEEGRGEFPLCLFCTADQTTTRLRLALRQLYWSKVRSVEGSESHARWMWMLRACSVLGEKGWRRGRETLERSLLCLCLSSLFASEHHSKVHPSAEKSVKIVG